MSFPSNHPGPQILNGNTDLGYYGVWDDTTDPSYISRNDVLSVCNPGGTNLFDDGWLKFSYQNKILFIAKKPLKYNISWSNIYQSGAVFGTNDFGPYNHGSNVFQNKEIFKNGYGYRIRLIKGCDQNPSEFGGGEWNDLFYRIHKSDPLSLGGNLWDDFNNLELGIGSGNGKSSWVQETHETANYPTRRILRGRFGVTSVHGDLINFSSNDFGWRPVLELFQWDEELPTTTTTSTTPGPTTTTTSTTPGPTTTTTSTTSGPTTTTTSTTSGPTTTTTSTTPGPTTTTTSTTPGPTTTTTTGDPTGQPARCCFNNNCNYSYKLTPSQKDVRLLHQIVDDKVIGYGFLYNWWALNGIVGGLEKKSGYGALYNWWVLDKIVNPQMDNWRVPSDKDWKDLELYLCIMQNEINDIGWRGVNEGNKIKSQRMVPNQHPRWNTHNENHLDSVGFSAHPSGYRFGFFAGLGSDSYHWSKSEYDSDSSYYRRVSISIPPNDRPKINRSFSDKRFGYSVRLVRDATMLEKTLKDGDRVENYIGNNGGIYSAVKIGKQIWTGENLNETKYNDKTLIPIVKDDAEWVNLETGAMCYYDNDESLSLKSLWRVPRLNDFISTRNYIINLNSTYRDSNVGNILKSCRQINSPLGGFCNVLEHPRWNEHNLEYGTNNFRFNGLPGGFRNTNGSYAMLGQRQHLWSLNEETVMDGWVKTLFYETGQFIEFIAPKRSGRSVKLTRDATTEEINKFNDGEYVNDYVGNNGLRYRAVKIGNLVYTENSLIETHYNDGNEIPEIQNNGIWSSLNTGARCSYGNNVDFSYIEKEKYVYLYTKPI